MNDVIAIGRMQEEHVHVFEKKAIGGGRGARMIKMSIMKNMEKSEGS